MRGRQIVAAIAHLEVTGFNATGASVGPPIDFANNASGFNVIFVDHTDVQFSGLINGVLVVGNRRKGVTHARTRLHVDPSTAQIISHAVELMTPRASVLPPDPALVEPLQPYRDALATAFDDEAAVATRASHAGTWLRWPCVRYLIEIVAILGLATAQAGVKAQLAALRPTLRGKEQTYEMCRPGVESCGCTRHRASHTHGAARVGWGQ